MKREQPKTPKGGVTKQPCVWCVERREENDGEWEGWRVHAMKLTRTEARGWLPIFHKTSEQYRIRKYIRADK